MCELFRVVGPPRVELGNAERTIRVMVQEQEKSFISANESKRERSQAVTLI
jgi:hypothetical protein